jgi:hypothetical protein
MDSHFLDGAQMTEALVREEEEIIKVFMILKDGVLIYIMKSTVGGVIVKSYRQNSVPINFVDSDE